MKELDKEEGRATPGPLKGRRLSWGFGGVSLAVLLAAAIGVLAAAETLANWRFGKIEVTNQGERQIKIYVSLRNHGSLSQEPASLWIVKADEIRPFETDKPALDLTERTSGKAASVVETELQIPERVGVTQAGYRLLLMVGQTATDMVPVVNGKPNLEASERRKFQN